MVQGIVACLHGSLSGIGLLILLQAIFCSFKIIVDLLVLVLILIVLDGIPNALEVLVFELFLI